MRAFVARVAVSLAFMPHLIAFILQSYQIATEFPEG